MITSLDSIVEATGDKGKRVSIRNVRTALKLFEDKYGFLTNESTKQGRLITIVNWVLYQGSDSTADKGNDKEVTKDRQTTDKEVTPIEEGKKETRQKGKKKEEPENKFSDDSIELNLARLLWGEIASRNEAFKRKKINSQNWAKDFDLMLRIDKCPEAEIRAVINFAVNDQFWAKNILCPSKLRKQYAKLFAAMRQPATFQKPTPVKRELPEAKFTTDTEF